MTIYTNSEKETQKVAMDMAKRAKPGMVICLDGDLGAGKTAWTKGFAQALGIDEPVVSPTFTIFHIYEGGRIPLYHFDVYRIEEPEEMYEIGYEEYFFGEGVCVVEWSENIKELIPKDAIKIIINRVDLENENKREIIIDENTCS